MRTHSITQIHVPGWQNSTQHHYAPLTESSRIWSIITRINQLYADRHVCILWLFEFQDFNCQVL